MDAIQPQSMSFGELFAHRLFEIPEYQRAYSWETKHRAALFGDIKRLIRGKNSELKGHFMATIVGLCRQTKEIGIDKYKKVEVVDGQQRITTLIILLKAIAAHVDDATIVEDLNNLLVKRDETSVLLSNHDSRGFFRDYIRTGEFPDPDVATRLSDRQMLLAMKECDTFVKMDSGITPTALASLVKNSLSCVFYELNDESAVYTVFEVLNSRGLDVSWFDRLKSMLMEAVFSSDVYQDDMNSARSTIDEVHGLWAHIYDTVGLRLGLSTESLRFAATLRNPERKSRLLSEEQAARTLADQSKDPARVIDTTKWLLRVTRAVDVLHSNRRLNAVTEITHVRLVGVAIALRDDFLPEDRTSVLRRWENVTFRIFGMFRKDARTKVGEYVRLAWDIVRKRLSAEGILDGLAAIGRDFPADQAVQELRKRDCYNEWREELRYLFQRREEYLARDQKFSNEQWNRIWMSTAATSIEHISPISSGRSDIHHLGNLVVLPPKLNSSLQDKKPKLKAGAYRDTGLLIAKEVAGQITANEAQRKKFASAWQKQDVAKREATLLKWARSEWSG